MLGITPWPVASALLWIVLVVSALYLARPTALEDRDRLVLEDGRHVEVIAAEEDLLEVRAADPRALTVLAWHIGNRHLPAQIEPDRILIARDHVIADMLAGLGRDPGPAVLQAKLQVLILLGKFCNSLLQLLILLIQLLIGPHQFLDPL